MDGKTRDDFFSELSRSSPKHRRTHEDSAARVFSWQGTDSGQSVANHESWVALDTNVLLLPYGAGKSSFGEIIEAYRKLSQQDRLVVPGQVAREFARNRPAVLASTVKAINDQNSKVPGLLRPQNYPFLGEIPAFHAAVAAFNKADAAVQSYKNALNELRSETEKLVHSDPVLTGYQTVFDDGVVFDPDISSEELDANVEFRMENAIPPGLKDSSKADGGFGDVLIWLTLLRLAEGSARDMVFVTEEHKSDWWHRSNSTPFLPRFELVDEYRRISNGGTLHLLSLSDFLKNIRVSEAVVTEIKALEAVTDFVGGAKNVRDGETLLIRGDSGYGAVRPIRQMMPPGADEAVEYLYWFSEDLEDYLEGRLTPALGRCSASSGTVAVGPYEVPWSGSSNGSGWFYYREYLGSLSTAVDYELAVVDSQVVEWDHFRSGMFFRGQNSN